MNMLNGYQKKLVFVNGKYLDQALIMTIIFNVKIRTITYGTDFEYPLKTFKLKKIGQFFSKTKEVSETIE